MTRPLARFRDAVPLPRGWFHLEVFRRGDLVEVVDEANMIVVGAEAILAGLLAGSVAAPGIMQIGVGASMVPPDFGNTALVTPYLKPVDGITQPVPSQAVVAFSFASGEANGLDIGEFGLFSAGNILFARKTRTYAVIPKDATVSLSGTWTVDYGIGT